MFFLLYVAITIYLWFRTIAPLPWQRWEKLLSILIVAIFSQQYAINKVVFGTMFSPEFPRPMVIATNAAFGSVLLLLVFQLALDMGLLACAAIKRKRIHAAAKLRYAIMIAAAALSCYGVSQAIVIPKVKEINIAISNLPDAFDGYRIIQLTDLHISKLFQRPWVEQVVKDTNALNADAIVITGDLIDGTLQARENDIAPLADLQAPDGVYVIPGNHEYYFGYPQWIQKFQDMNMVDLSNKHITLTKEQEQLVIAGVVDNTSKRMGLEEPDLTKALKDSPTGAPIILLDHKPAAAKDAAQAGVALQLSGHTHGGMIRGFDIIVARFNSGFVSGLYPVDDMQLYVNNGTALWLGFAIRLGVPPELTVITLRKK